MVEEETKKKKKKKAKKTSVKEGNVLQETMN
jgi:hypothetical protein